MSRSADASYALKRRLLFWLFATITIGVLIQAAVSYRVAIEEVDLLSDYHMEHMALALKGGLPPPAMPDELDTEAPDNGFDMTIQAWTLDGERVLGAASTVKRVPPRPTEGFSTFRKDGHAYRAFVIRHQGGTIQVTNDMSARNSLARKLAWRTTTPVILMAPVLLLGVWWLVSLSLRPVEAARAQVADRSPDDLSPLPSQGLPRELLPFVQEINALFTRIRLHLSSQQQFIADAAHELRSPLAALRLQVQSQQRAQSETDRDMTSRRLLAGIDRSTRLVEQLLVLARQEAPSASAAAHQVDLSEVVQMAIADVAAPALDRHIDLGAENLSSVLTQADPDALRIALRNLLDNAVKYTPPHGTVDISLHMDSQGRAVIQVEDSGSGIAADDLPRVFDRFYRGHATEAVGSGLGLSIVKAICDRHGATIRLERSPRLGGLLVHLVFPAAATPT